MKASIILTVVTVLAAKVSAKCWAEDLGWPCCSPGNTDVYYVDNDGEWGVEDGDWCGMATEDDTSNNNDPWSFDMSNTGGNTGVNTGGFDMGGFGGQGGFDMGAFGGFGGQGGQGGFDMGAFGGQGGQGGFGGFDMGGFGGFGGQGGQGGFDMGAFGGQGGQGGFGGFDMGGFGGQGGQGGFGGFDMGGFGGQGGQGGFGGFDMGGFGGQGGQGGFGGFDMGGFGGQGGQSFGGFDMGGFGGGNTMGGFTQNDFLGNNDPNAGLGGNSSYETVAAQGSDVNCSGKTLKSNTTLNINGRKVIVKFPSGFSGDKPAPLLINYHPIMGSASQWEGGSQTAKAALSDGAVVAFMDGAQGPMGQAWNVGPCCTDADDVQFTRDFIKQITAQACVDPKRIYAAGFSMGGGMSNYAGCFLSDVIAAAAPSAFDLAQEVVSAGKCKPSRPFPILNFRGTQDNVVMYNGGLSQVVAGKPITFLGAKGNFAEWAKMNGCTGTPKSNTPGNGCEMYENCEGGAKVGLCTINGGGHSEGDGRMGWNFLKQFSL